MTDQRIADRRKQGLFSRFDFVSLMSEPAFETRRAPWQGWFTSIAFWICLFMAAGLYGTVALAPKLLAYVGLETEYRANQWRLAEIDRQVCHLQRVIDAHTTDPAFVKEQARNAFEVAGADEQRIPVDSHLRLNIESAPAPAASRTSSRRLPWYAPLLACVASSHRVGNGLLLGSAALIVYAFAFLYERRTAV
jgi:hypothetical protein